MNFDNIFKEDLTSYDRGYLVTEHDNPLSRNLDVLDIQQIVDIFVEEDLLPQRAVSNAKSSIVRAIELITERMVKGGKLYYLGAGTSGRLGVLDSSEIPPTFCTSPELVQGIIAGGESALLKSSEGTEDCAEIAVKDLKSASISSLDCLIGITAGGTTPYVKEGLNYAKEINALSIAISCVPFEQAMLPCDIDIRLLTGPEVITGSTRLKAGTATKMALNIISSTVMIRLGKVYGNRMIDVACSNKKLIDRSLRILFDLQGINREDGLSLLELSKGSVKVALLMSACDIDFHSATKLLSENEYHLRKALSKAGCSLKTSDTDQ